MKKYYKVLIRDEEGYWETKHVCDSRWEAEVKYKLESEKYKNSLVTRVKIISPW